jgi:hypothetical protein
MLSYTSSFLKCVDFCVILSFPRERECSNPKLKNQSIIPTPFRRYLSTISSHSTLTGLAAEKAWSNNLTILPVTFLKTPYWSASSSHIPSFWLAPCPQPLLFRSYKNPSTSLPCHFSPWRSRQHVSPKRRHRPANIQGAKTQDFYNNNNLTINEVLHSNREEIFRISK